MLACVFVCFSPRSFCFSVFFSGRKTYFRPVAPSSKALCSSHDFAVRGETSTDGCGNAGCTQQTLGGETDGMWVMGMWVSDEGCFFFKKKQEVVGVPQNPPGGVLNERFTD